MYVCVCAYLTNTLCIKKSPRVYKLPNIGRKKYADAVLMCKTCRENVKSALLIANTMREVMTNTLGGGYSSNGSTHEHNLGTAPVEISLSCDTTSTHTHTHPSRVCMCACA